LFQALMSEFPEWLGAARAAGIVHVRGRARGR
jgi:hypothetical protein